jgi:hypothetical protein
VASQTAQVQQSGTLQLIGSGWRYTSDSTIDVDAVLKKTMKNQLDVCAASRPSRPATAISSGTPAEA